jgi:hypothetical protein
METGTARTSSETAKATVGRIVHFCLDNGENCPGVVVNATGEKLNLQLFRDLPGIDGYEYEKQVPYSANPKPGTWHWPQQV